MNDFDMLAAMVCDDTTTASKQTRDGIKMQRMEFETQENGSSFGIGGGIFGPKIIASLPLLYKTVLCFHFRPGIRESSCTLCSLSTMTKLVMAYYIQIQEQEQTPICILGLASCLLPVHILSGYTHKTDVVYFLLLVESEITFVFESLYLTFICQRNI